MLIKQNLIEPQLIVSACIIDCKQNISKQMAEDYLLHHLSIEKISVKYGVSRRTVLRRLAKALRSAAVEMGIVSETCQNNEKYGAT